MQVTTLLKDKSDLLDYVFRVDSKTIGIKLFKTKTELLKDWKNSMYELCSGYQMKAETNLKWDFYLALPCLFNKSDISESNRFEIESDRFGCRKIIFFNQKENYDPNKLFNEITPELILDKKVDLITSENIIKDIKDFQHKDLEKFLTQPMNDTEILSFLKNIRVSQ